MPIASTSYVLPALPLKEWEPTYDTLHLWLQIVGKIRLGLHPKLNHWWHAPFYVTPRGLSTHPIPLGAGKLELEFNFLSHTLTIDAGAAGTMSVELHDGLSVAAFHASVFARLTELGIRDVPFLNKPFDVPAISTTPFDRDTDHASYSPEHARLFLETLTAVDNVFLEYRARFIGKSTPPHYFWHHMDLAVTRFSGRVAPPRPGANIVEREAYSHEVISCGWWPGDKEVRAPAFYGYAAPAPKGLFDQPLKPDKAYWLLDKGMALLMHDDARAEPNPRQAVLDFLESVYMAGATQAGWDVEGCTLANYSSTS
ncbi:DUF5996 family protein [Desulfocurvibacter africanus]|uniref:Ava_C0101 and related proteins n=1 Tax=Desulfocurvibacter africanus subsp. africanus str. Walvis Bay TaxID=690850 RepID=F3Z0G9_DESAF|nr:DUF5996 family protein [Desulfocurvibacter africanus]EGJ50979.1 hypothetical protein Desaf_2662 [Desulfocurvibacter africanus subsp. africanus str. Walvis Bay]